MKSGLPELRRNTMNDVTMKTCNFCGKIKPLSAFHRPRDAYAHECIDCNLLTASGQQGKTPEINSEQALRNLTLLSEKASKLDFHEFILDGIQRKVPTEILTRMEDLWDITKRIGGNIIAIGKIIVMRIFDFLKANPKLVAGLAIGVIAYFLSNSIPFIGPIVAPLLATVVAIYTLYKITTLKEIMDMVKGFFELLVSIFDLVTQRWAI
jgi:hypothetical protein